jgi:riboflavin synthase
MFTGIVEELGEITGRDVLVDAARLTIRGPVVTADAGHGDSIAVNGVCLTVAELLADGQFTADVMAETLDRSNLGELQVGKRVNLERAAAVNSRLGGHIVQGHVDGVGTIAEVTPDGFSRRLRITAPPELLRYLVYKGSITVDGVSLTVAGLDARSFTVSLIPETLERTNLGHAEPGVPVNLEVDVLAKYVERLMPGGNPS